MAKKFVAVIGPVGCGKSTLSAKYFGRDASFVSISPDHYPTGIVDRKTKNQRIVSDISAASKKGLSIVLDNGSGALKIDGIFSDYRTIELIAPSEIVGFIMKWPVTKIMSISPSALEKSPFMTGLFSQIETIPRCMDAYSALESLFVARTVQACEYRLATGIFHINYFGSHMKVGHFKNRESMLEIMTNVTITNMKILIVMLMWARFNGHRIIPMTYNPEDHSVSI